MSFAQALLAWFRKHARPMPWRDLGGRPDPYRVWVSEMMLQQTTVATVRGYYERFLAAFPSVDDLAKAEERQLLKLWQGLVYYTRARNMGKAARIIAVDKAGVFPSRSAELLQLPGVGPYTAAAVASIAFGERIPLVDANVRRVMMRILAIDAVISTAHDPLILNQLEQWLPRTKPGHFNQAMMELGSLVCRPAEPTCNVCPVRSFCRAYDSGKQEIIPRPAQRKVQKISAVIAIIEKNGKVLLQQRPAKGLLAGLWEFPGGKVEPTDPSPAAALCREVREETGLRVTPGEKVASVTHAYTQFRVQLTAFLCTLEEPGQRPVNPSARWVARNRLARYPMPSGSAKVLDIYLGNPPGTGKSPGLL